MQPALFIGHGSPMNALGGNSYAQYLGKLGRELTRPKAILAVSAHWETRGTEVLEAEAPATIHDFFGFPPELYRIQYPAPGAPELAARVSELLGHRATRTKTWGFDHGTWAVLNFLYPGADIPVTQLSLNKTLSMREHFDLAARLKPLRDEGFLLIGSGNIVHNLRDFSWNAAVEPFPWAEKFDALMERALLNRDLDMLLDFKGIEPELVRRAAPSPEHYAPLAYALGFSEAKEKVSFPFTEMQNGSIAMRSVRFG